MWWWYLLSKRCDHYCRWIGFEGLKMSYLKQCCLSRVPLVNPHFESWLSYKIPSYRTPHPFSETCHPSFAIFFFYGLHLQAGTRFFVHFDRVWYNLLDRDFSLSVYLSVPFLLIRSIMLIVLYIHNTQFTLSYQLFPIVCSKNVLNLMRSVSFFQSSLGLWEFSPVAEAARQQSDKILWFESLEWTNRWFIRCWRSYRILHNMAVLNRPAQCHVVTSST